MKLGDLISGTRIWASVHCGVPHVRGRLAPRLFLPLELSTPSEQIETTITQARVSVLDAKDEFLGGGWLLGETIGSHGRHCSLEVPVSRAAIDRITANLRGESQVALKLQWYGQLRVLWRPTSGQVVTNMGDVKPGEPTDLHLSNQNDQLLTIARSDWYSHIVGALGEVDYLFLEIAVPRSEDGAEWRAVLEQLRAAERAYSLGDDPGVFLRLRGALDALPGAKKNIYSALPEPKRAQADAVAKALGEYLHIGRHVQGSGEQRGSFRVDHQDAAFALNLMRVLLAYTSQVLTAANQG